MQIRNIIIIFFFVLISASTFGQSKKELEAKIAFLEAQIVQLKKPVEVDLNDPTKKAGYGMGVLLASNIKAQGGDSLNVDAIMAGMHDVFGNKTLKMDQQQCSSTVQQFMREASDKKSSKAKEQGRLFLENNKKNPGVMVTTSGLQYKVLASGTGKTPGPNDKVTVHYTGKLIDGTIFDSSVQRGQPIDFGVTQVIRGWTEALQLMKEGDKWILYIPSDLAYGERGAGAQIPPNSALIFEVELIKVN